MANVHIVTTASVPWLTGTAINPLFRAAYLARRGVAVTLHAPYLDERDQAAVFPPGASYASPGEQARAIRAFLPAEVRDAGLAIELYPARWSARLGSIYPTRDVASFVPRCDALVLEEPEHLLQFQPLARLARRFRRVLGIFHTNYAAYLPFVAGRQAARVLGPLQAAYYRWLARSSCHDTVRLSGAIDMFPSARTVNLNGVAPEYFRLRRGATRGLYFVGKLVWAKGFRELLDVSPRLPAVDVYGAGPDGDAIAAAAGGRGLRLAGPLLDKAILAPYRAFINTSRSEVLCTTTAEAIAMGKWVVLPDHPSNEPFRSHATCLFYRTSAELVENVQRALASEPPAIDASALSWDAATDRLLPLLGLAGAPSGTSRRPPDDGELNTGKGSLAWTSSRTA